MAPRRTAPTHGGARPGAGRKPGPAGPRAVTLNVRLTAAQADTLEGLRSPKAATRSAVVAAWLDAVARKASKAARA
jgi:hypothetical protein